MLISSFVEAVSISAILPFLASLTAPEDIGNIALLRHLPVNLEEANLSDIRLTFTLIFMGLVLFAGSFRVMFFFYQTRLSMLIGNDLSTEVYGNILRQPYAALIKRNSSEILAGAQKAKDLVGSIIQPTLTIVNSIFILTAVIITIITIEPKMTFLCVFGFGSLYVLSTVFTRHLLHNNSKIYAKELIHVNQTIQEGVGGIRDIIIDSTQQIYTNLYATALKKMQLAGAQNLILTQMPRFIIETVGIVFLSGLAYLSLQDRSQFSTSIPALGLVALGAQRLLPVLQQTYSSYATIKGGLESTFDALELLSLKTLNFPTTSAASFVSFNHLLRIENVSFSYNYDKKLILNGLDLEIQKGGCIGFVGATGSGKSTLVDLIMGLLQPKSGSILIDDQKLCESNLRSWHSLISHVPQSIFLADTSILENIAFGIEYSLIDWGRVQEAAKISQLSDFIEGLPDGYHTKVGERGVRLSGGQRQRIGIARALYKKSRVLVLDEATSSLDNETESRIMQEISNLQDGLTILIVAHRINTLRNCDTLIELKNGQINWKGSYEEFQSRVSA